jgi:glycosyltransferase involved in cell wall biosynthesis
MVIPCFNERNTIEKIMDPVCASSIQHKEIIVVDDCSTDGTREILATQLPSRIGQVIYHRIYEVGISYYRRS